MTEQELKNLQDQIDLLSGRVDILCDAVHVQATTNKGLMAEDDSLDERLSELENVFTADVLEAMERR
jgi:hypothetical protein